jgi:hypothetical protein
MLSCHFLDGSSNALPVGGSGLIEWTRFTVTHLNAVRSSSVVRSVESHGHGHVFGVRPGQRFAGGRAGHALVALTPFRNGSREETSAQEVTAPGSTCITHAHTDDRHKLKTRIDIKINNNNNNNGTLLYVI